MLPELSIERVFQRELDVLPLPAEHLWVPTQRPGPSPIVALAIAGAALLLVVAAAGLIREVSGAATQPRSAVSPPPSLPARATCAPSATTANVRCVTLLPNAVRNPALGYNLAIPGDWREVRMPFGTDPFVIGPPNAGPLLTAPFLLDRHVFTARSPQEWSAVAGVVAPAWDLDVQVWDRQGRTAIDWARAFPCDDPAVTLGGPTNCVQRSDTIRGVPVVLTTVYQFRWHITSYYVERGDQIVILRYLFSEMIAPPPGVTEGTLEDIIHSIGLV